MMNQVAVFVDAGYLFAQGSTCLFGSKQKRETLQLDEAAVFTALSSFALAKSDSARLMRIYWYDGAGFRPTPEHDRIAARDNAKIRFGFINSHGQQKGVDTLIVTDMIDLARNKSISDAVLLSGDEDVRIGVQLAQSYGVRVHLLGIFPGRGSQSRQLMQEADTTSVWDHTITGSFLSQRQAPMPPVVSAAPVSGATSTAPKVSTIASNSKNSTITDDLVSDLVRDFGDHEITEIQAHVGGNQSGLPKPIDGRLLAIARSILQRDLSQPEKRDLRAKIRSRLMQS